MSFYIQLYDLFFLWNFVIPCMNEGGACSSGMSACEYHIIRGSDAGTYNPL